MALAWTWLALPGFLAFALAVAAALYLFRASPDRAVNRRLPPILVLESMLALGSAVLAIATPPGTDEQDARLAWSGVVIGIALAALPLLYLRFLATLETPLVAWLRRPAVDRTLLALTPIGVVATLLQPRVPAVAEAIGAVFILGGFVATSVYGIVASVSLYRRSPPGSARRARARAYAAAFIARDILWASLFIAQVVAGVVYGSGYVDGILIPSILAPLTVFVYVPLMAYGALKTQLFDIDLRVKVGIRRSTVVGIILVVVFVLAKVVESYLNRTAGFVAGSAVAGLMLFLVPKLNKVGEKVANTAMPQVQPTTGYVAFKKLEVYKAAVESAYEEAGAITPRERGILDRLRGKLALSAEDCAAVEAEVSSRG